MDVIDRLVRRCQGRFAVQAWARAFLWALAVCSALPLVWVVAVKVVGERWSAGSDPLWMAVACVAAVVLASIAGMLFRERTPSPIAMASVVDHRLGLKDRLSTALAVRERSDPFAVAAVDDAVQVANEQGVSASYARALPFSWPRLWWGGPGVLALAWLLFVVVPGWSTSASGSDGADPGSESRVESMRDRLDAVVKTVTDDPRLKEELAAEIERAQAALNANDDRSLAERERELAKRLTEMAQKLEALKENAQSKGLQQTKDALANLQVPKDSAIAPLAEALKQGDVAGAKEALKDLQQKMKDGSMSEAEREQAKKDLEALAKKLEELAKNKDALRKALEDAGMDPSMADSPEALKRAIEQSKQLNQAQKEQLKQALDAAQQMQQNMQRLSGACKACKNAGQQGQSGQKGQQGQQGNSQEGNSESSSGDQGSSGESAQAAGGEASEMLDDLEAQQQMDQASASASGECKGGGKGPTELAQAGSQSSGESEGDGGMGQRGQGRGGEAPKEVTKTKTVTRREKVTKGQGPIIARQLVEGPAITGEAATALKAVAGDVARKAESATAEDPVPPHLREAHQRYFGDVRKQLEKKTGQVPASPSKPTAPAAGGTP